MNYVGGLRIRLVKDSFANMLQQSLTDLGWFNSGRDHLPVKFLSSHVPETDELKPNVVGVSTEDLFEDLWEMGSNWSSYTWQFYVDIYAENDSVGLHLAGDCKDILQGRIDSIGRSDDRLDVYDYTLATPNIIFSCDIEDVRLDRSRVFAKPHQKYWYVVSCSIRDAYSSELRS